MNTISPRRAVTAALLLALIPSACAQIAGLKDYQVGPQGEGGRGGAGGTGGAGGEGGAGGTGGAAMVCEPDSTMDCYTGPDGTKDIGACKHGTTTCNAQGTGYGPCNNQITPATETCVTLEDDDCDGIANEDGVDCGCTPNMAEPCYSGPPGTENNLPCKAGTRTCNPQGTGYGPCTGEVLPKTEACSPALDENCDGTQSCTGGYLWAKTYPNGSAYTYDVAIDAAGNVFATGIFEGTVDFGGGPLVNTGAYDVFLLKLDPSGAFLWAKQFGDMNDQYGQSVATDAAGNVILAGYFVGSIDFGGGALTNAGGEDIYVAKLNANGGHVWSKAFGDDQNQEGLAVAVDKAGDIVVTGYMLGSADFGGGDLASGASEDIFIAKLGPTGDHLWSKRFGDAAAKQFAYGIAVDDAGDVFVTGAFAGTIDFGGGALMSAGGEDVFIAKLAAADGGYLWAKRFGDNANQAGINVATDPSGNALLIGHYNGSVNLGGMTFFAGAAQKDVFIAKFGGGGAHQWSKDFGDSSEQFGQGVAADGEGNVVLTGYFMGAIDLGGGPLTSAGGQDVYLAKLDPGGAQIWAKRFGETNSQFATSVAVDAAGNIVLGGYFAGDIDFGGGVVSSNTDAAFVTKLLP